MQQIRICFYAFSTGRADAAERVALLSPSGRHPMGTDPLGRDVLSRIIYGYQVSLKVGFVSVGLSTLIGLLVGSLAGFYGGRADLVLMRFVDLMLCFPSFFLILAVIAMLEPSTWNIMVVIGVTGWMGVARLVRAEFLSLREREFVVAARALGASDLRLILRHLLPNALAPVMVSATLGVAGAILTESALSFLGLGVQPPTPSWGNILTAGKDNIEIAWWLSVFPGLAILPAVSALEMTLAGGALLVLAHRESRGLRYSMAGALGATVTALALVDLMALVTGLLGTLREGLFLGGTLPEVLAYLALGAWIAVYAWQRDAAAPTVPQWVPVAAGLALLVASVFVWRALVSEQNAQLALRVEAQARQVRREVGRQVLSHSRTLRNVAGRTRTYRSEALWLADASVVLETLPRATACLRSRQPPTSARPGNWLAGRESRTGAGAAQRGPSMARMRSVPP